MTEHTDDETGTADDFGPLSQFTAEQLDAVSRRVLGKQGQETPRQSLTERVRIQLNFGLYARDAMIIAEIEALETDLTATRQEVEELRRERDDYKTASEYAQSIADAAQFAIEQGLDELPPPFNAMPLPVGVEGVRHSMEEVEKVNAYLSQQVEELRREAELQQAGARKLFSDFETASQRVTELEKENRELEMEMRHSAGRNVELLARVTELEAYKALADALNSREIGIGDFFVRYDALSKEGADV